MSRPRPTARVVLAPVAVAAVVATAWFVGDDGGAPGSPDPESGSTSSERAISPEEFCAGFADLARAQEAQLRTPSAAAVAELKSAAGTVRDLAAGAPLPDDARAGVDYVVTAFLGLPDDATAEDVVRSDDGATVTDDAHAQALATYVAEECPVPGGPAGP